MNSQKLINEIEHGKFIAQKGEKVWNWSSPAGKIRWERRVSMFKEFLKNNNKKVLEIGCGTGLFTKEIAGTENEITAIDISSELCEIAKNRINKKNVVFLVDDVCHTKFSNNSFDFIIGSSVLHHLDVDSALEEFHRLLKPGGQIIFTEPNMLNPQIALQKNIPFLKKMAGDSPDETAFIRWKIEKKMKNFGFINVSAVPFDFLHPSAPVFMVKFLQPIFSFFERVPLLKEIAGSLIIKGEK
ncbi:MAG: methyltransferase domain-containing protein [bacterium]